jgi:hypothetical protein
LGVRRCPGCRTRLLNSVTLGKASTFIALGLAVGLVAGGFGGLLIGLAQTAAAAPAGAAGASSALIIGATGSKAPATTAPAVTSPPATTGTGVPPVARAALGQVVGLNARLVTAQAALRDALSTRMFDASDVAATLRTVSADSLFGSQLATHVSSWSASPIGPELAAFYAEIHDTASAGLVASVQNQGAYRTAATAMVKLLDGVDAVDASARSTAASAGIDLPAPSTAP